MATTETGSTYQRMHHDRLDESSWDRPPRAEGAERRVIVCSTPRSGSYLLCRQMINAGLGLPTEYLRERTVAALCARWSIAPGDDDAYLTAVEARRTGDNGLFAAKVQAQQLLAHPAAGSRWLERADLLVLLHRRDIVAQAASWQVSLATGYWSFDSTRGPIDPRMSLDDTGTTVALANAIVRQNAQWRRRLAALKRRAIEFAYEDYVDRQEDVLRLIAAEVGLPAGAWRVPPPEGRDSRLPPQIEEARARLIAALRERWRG
ncbi:MAG: Stf0 family sulfotransferase [Burkholderiales bacterium]